MFLQALFTRCRKNCNCQILKEHQTSIAFNERRATGSISTRYEPQISTSFDRLWNLVRDQGVGGSNPLSPTNYFQLLTATGTQVVSKPTPVEFALNPGRYEIKLELEGYATLQKMVEVNAGKRIQVEETLTKK